jgi:hypothetical protein
MNYICDLCGGAFDELSKIEDPREHFGTPCAEVFWVSPCCGVGYDHAYRCKGCDSLTPLLEVENGLCVYCQEAVEKKFKAFCDTLTSEEKDYLNTIMLGADEIF